MVTTTVRYLTDTGSIFLAPPNYIYATDNLVYKLYGSLSCITYRNNEIIKYKRLLAESMVLRWSFWDYCLPLVILGAGAALLAGSLLADMDNTGTEDWDQFCFFDEVPRKTILEYRQFPLWNPYTHGGRPLLANPQVSFTRPTFIFTLVFGCVVGLKIEAVVMMLVGLLGMWLLARHYRLKPKAAALSAATFAFSSYFMLHIAAGHVMFFTWFLLPYVFLFFVKALEQKAMRPLIFAAIFLALILIGGGAVYTFVPLTAYLLVYAGVEALRERKIRPFVCLIIVVLLSLGIGAFKVFPMLEYLNDHPRLTNTTDFTPPSALLQVFAGQNQSMSAHNFQGQGWQWYEYGAYTGVLPLTLAIAGLLIRRRRDAVSIAVAGACATLVSMGGLSIPTVWHFLHKLPFIGSMHIPSRFFILSVFTIALLAGFACQTFEQRFAKNPLKKALLFLVVLIAIINVVAFSRQPLLNAFPNEPRPVSPNEGFRQFLDLDPRRSDAFSSMHDNLRENKGTINGYDLIPHAVYALWPGRKDYRGEIFLEGDGTASYASWSPNMLVTRVSATNATRLVLNQNYGPGWIVRGDNKIEAHRGLIAARISPGDHDIAFVYRPSSFVLGTIVSLAMLIGILLMLWNWQAQRKIANALLILAVLITLVAFLENAQKADAPVVQGCEIGSQCQACSYFGTKQICMKGICAGNNLCTIKDPAYANLTG